MQLCVSSSRKLKKIQLKYQNQEERPENLCFSQWKSFAQNTSIHGIHYLVSSTSNIIEKLIWALLITVALAGMVDSCVILSNIFQASLLSTVFESTNYKVSQIPFAAVTLCNNNRLDYNKTDAAIAKFFPNRSESETETFVKFVHTLQNMEWGSFDEFVGIADDDVSEMDKLNISQIYEFMMHDCDAFFVSCSWKRIPFNCCDFFSRQLSEYGICWSFNSYSNVGSKFVNVSFYDFKNDSRVQSPNIQQRSSNFPLRIQRSGLKTALRVMMNTHPETSIDRSALANSNPGVMAMVHHPYEWPSSSFFIAADSPTALKIRPTAFSTSVEVSDLEPQQRQCNYNVRLWTKLSNDLSK